MQANELIARILQKEGVEVLTCFPHSEIIDGAAAVGIRPVMARTERVALNIAESRRRIGRDQTQGYRIAAGSADEARTALRLAEAYGYVPEGRVANALDMLERILKSRNCLVTRRLRLLTFVLSALNALLRQADAPEAQQPQRAMRESQGGNTSARNLRVWGHRHRHADRPCDDLRTAQPAH